MIRSKIIATGAYIPTERIPNEYFLNATFFEGNQSMVRNATETVIDKFSAITGIMERRYASSGIAASDMAVIAAQEAIANAGIDPESIDQVIVAHNYGDMSYPGAPRDAVPSLASRVKHKLGIHNPRCIPYDIIFGCPGWLQAVIQADLAMRSGMAHTSLVIGSETLSRVLDPSDRDSMIFSDGAGASILQVNSEDDSGILSVAMRSDTTTAASFIFSGGRNDMVDSEPRFIKMNGRKVYEYVLDYVPRAMKECFDQIGESISALKMVFLHQANEKMDQAIIKRFYSLYGLDQFPENIMPMNIAWMGNSSVATIPTLLHQVVQGQLKSFELKKGDTILMASVGAGMNINALTYRW
ncbi:MAG TPA: 3-oxoacyl-ACP synthase III family protein [Parapedobacter sp.]|uniref:3-oxoacyl-ACP synthase III family protein n=1 Tax=Parapedobacter sp. TaxID=1958893 RepID=UPI002CE4073C|nr:3-oxoacyl-ACP synthase III family protein [Parapedobacter sp.]HWK58047.1 3-oxoacyl-ACP synthase III family protein [Parapedobacter sp.]